MGGTSTGASAASPTPEPVLRIVSADATAEEVAALVAVLASLGGGDEPAAEPAPEWSAPRRLHRSTGAPRLPHGPGGWRSSALPR